MTEPLLAYLGQPTLKTRMLAEIEEHRKADQIVPGLYGNYLAKHFIGCAVGCALHSLNRITQDAKPTDMHERFPSELGIPTNVAWAMDHIFERLPKDRAQTWPGEVMAAIPVGADLSQVIDKAVLWTLRHDLETPIDYPEGIARHEQLIALYERRLAGDEPPDSEWQAVEQSAWDAWDATFALAAWAARAARAARAAWDARAARAAWDARAAWAARAARAAWDAWAARDVFYQKLADSLLNILRSSPVPLADSASGVQ